MKQKKEKKTVERPKSFPFECSPWKFRSPTDALQNRPSKVDRWANPPLRLPKLFPRANWRSSTPMTRRRGPLMMRPYPRASGAYTRLPILRYTSPETKRSLCNRGVLNGCVYDRISSVIKKALQCVRVSKRGRATVVRVARLESTPRRPYPGDKTFTILRATKVHHPPSSSNPPFCSIYPRCLLK